MAEMEGVEVSEPFVALKGETPELTLYCYEKLKQDMDFDPQIQVEVPLLCGEQPWNLHEDHPVDIAQRVRELANGLGWTREQLEQEWAWMGWLFDKERSEKDADEPAR